VVQPRAGCSRLLIFDRSGSRSRGEDSFLIDLRIHSVLHCSLLGVIEWGAATQLACIDLIPNLIICLNRAY